MAGECRNVGEDTVTVLTLNCWGVKYISKNYAQRTAAIQEELSKGRHDIVALQEVWENDWYERMRKRVKDAYPYAHYFHSGVIGSGLCIFSRYPIIDANGQLYPLNGYFYALTHCDWFAGKGVMSCVIQHPKKNIHIFNTHLHANYTKHEYRETRTLQAYYMARFVEVLTESGDAVILCGDMNHEEDEIGMQTVLTLGNLKSAWEESEKKLSQTCLTCGHPEGQFSEGEEQKCIDFILFNPDTFVSKECGLDLHLIPGTKQSFSDHVGVAAKLKICGGNQTTANCKAKDCSRHVEILRELSGIMSHAMKQVEDIQWQRTGVIWFIFLIFLFMPVFSADSFHIIFPNVQSFSGKVVFVMQIIGVVGCIIYAWILGINRRMEVNCFKNCLKEIELKLKYFENL